MRRINPAIAWRSSGRTAVALAVVLALFVAPASANRAATAQIGGADVNVITGMETWPHVTQSEDQIAINGATVVVNYNDSKDVTLSPINFSGVSVSTNGGVTFTRLLPSPFATGHGDNFGDPFVVYNQKLATWFAGDLVTGCGMEGLGLWTSANGTAWAAGVCAHSGDQDDRPSLAVDNTPSSPFYGRMYLTYNDFNSSPAGKVFATHSDDGTTWTAPVQVSTTFLRGLRVAVAPDGTVLEAAMDENGGGFNPRSNFVFRSTNGGVSFGAAVSQGAAYATPGDSLSGFTKMDPIWRNYGTGDLAVGSGGVAIDAYAVHGSGADGGDIYIVRSTDNGVGWGAPVRVDGDPGTKGQWMPSVSGGDLNFLVAWYDRRNTSNGVNYERWGTTSTNGGVSWSTPDRISDVLIPQPEQPDPNIQPIYAGDYMRDAYASNTFYDAWTDGRVTVMDPTGAPHFQQDVFLDKIIVTPTAAAVSSFAARASSRRVELTWRTASEAGILGFQVWRRAGDGQLLRVTTAMIRAKRSGSAAGARYRFVDRHAVREHAVYRLQLVGLDGQRRWVATARA